MAREPHVMISVRPRTREAIRSLKVPIDPEDSRDRDVLNGGLESYDSALRKLLLFALEHGYDPTKEFATMDGKNLVIER